MNPLGEITASPAMQKNGKDPLMEAIKELTARVDTLVEQQEEILEKLHDIESSMRFIGA